MTLQDVYYLLSIFATVMFIGILVFIGLVVWKIYSSIEALRTHITQALVDPAAGIVSSPQTKIASMIGVGLGSLIHSQLKKMFKK